MSETKNNPFKNRWFIIGLVLIAVGGAWYTGLFQAFTLENMQAQQQNLNGLYQENALAVILTYFAVYVLVTALSVPGAAVLTLLGGAIFGLWVGTLVISFASTLGASLAFLLSRYLFRDWVEQKFQSAMQGINQGMEKQGPMYLFALRLVPAFPFFVINLAMGLTKIRLTTYFWVSQLGMLPGTLVYVNAGGQLAAIETLKDIVSLPILGSFVLLALFPFLAQRVLRMVQEKRALAGFEKPKQFDRNLIVIGAGSGGLVSAYIAAAVKAKVTLAEAGRMGGDCLNTGCVPSKALIRSAKLWQQVREARRFGFEKGQLEMNFAAVMERVQNVIGKIEPHDSVERYTGLGVEVISQYAKVLSPWEVELEGQRMSARNLIIASGARPFVPPIAGLEQINYYTSDNIWDLREKPQRLIVLGGGPIGCELSQAFTRLDVQVTQVEMAERLMIREDEDVSKLIQQRFADEGIEVLCAHKAERVEVKEGTRQLICKTVDGAEKSIEFDTLLVAVGRVANTQGFGLEELGVRLRTNGTIEVDEYQQSSVPGVYACGDVCGPYQFTHTASHQAWYAAVNALFGRFKRFKTDYRVIPWATFSDPEVARVGLNEQEAQQQGVDYELTRYGIDDLDRAIADSEAVGFVKVLTVPGKDKILGVTIVGTHAAEMIGEFVLAMKYKLGLNKILGTIHLYPGYNEANKYAAGEWKRAHAPEKLLQWLQRWHASRL